MKANISPLKPDLRVAYMAPDIDRAIFRGEDRNAGITALYLTGDPHHYCRHDGGICLVKAWHDGGLRAVKRARKGDRTP